MAIYQFYLAIIPKEGFIKKFGTLSSDFKLVSERDEINLNIEKWWQLEEIDTTVLVSEIEEIIGGERERWSDTHCFSWKNSIGGKDNDACLEINTNSNYVQHISFRADLRKGKGQFLLDMIEFVYQKGWLFMDRKGNIIEPKIERVIKFIELSTTYEFLRDPITFLTGIVEETINPE